MAGSLDATFTATVAVSGTTSGAINLQGFAPCGLYFPATTDGTTVTFQASADGTTYYPIYGTDGNQISYTIAASRYVPLDPSVFAGVAFLKLVLGTQSTTATVVGIGARRLG